MSISTNGISDIENSNCRYQQFRLQQDLFLYQHIKLSISTIRIVDINNYLLISTIGIIAIEH